MPASLPGSENVPQPTPHIELQILERANTGRNAAGLIRKRLTVSTPPDGVLYPRISMEFVKVERSRDVPKEWKAPLVPEPGKEQHSRRCFFFTPSKKTLTLKPLHPLCSRCSCDAAGNRDSSSAATSGPLV